MAARCEWNVRKSERREETKVVTTMIQGKKVADGTREMTFAMESSHPYSFGLFVKY